MSECNGVHFISTFVQRTESLFLKIMPRALLSIYLLLQPKNHQFIARFVWMNAMPAHEKWPPKFVCAIFENFIIIISRRVRSLLYTQNTHSHTHIFRRCVWALAPKSWAINTAKCMHAFQNQSNERERKLTMKMRIQCQTEKCSNILPRNTLEP